MICIGCFDNNYCDYYLLRDSGSGGARNKLEDWNEGDNGNCWVFDCSNLRAYVADGYEIVLVLDNYLF